MAERAGIWKGSLRLPPEAKATVKQAAASEGISMNRWMVRAIEAHVARTEEAVRRGAKARQRAR
jgi:uncharacterized protein (DUF1778 family)